MKMVILALLVMLLSVPVCANDLSLIFTDSVVAADSADERADTAYSSAVDMRDLMGKIPTVFSFYSRLSAYGLADDTNWVDDTFFVNIQTSPNGLIGWTTIAELDTFLTNDSGWAYDLLKPVDTTLGPYFRAQIIHWDSIAVGEADSTLVNRSAPFKKQLILWMFSGD